MIGILGGTFDPVHYGHLRTATEVGKALDLDRILLIPLARPPHREPPVASAEQRLQMLQLATKDFAQLEVNDCELRLGGVSYTVRTLEHLRHQFGHAVFCLIVGADAFLGLESWHQWQRLFELAHIVVMQRPGFDLGANLPSWAVPRLASSLTDLRAQTNGRIWIQPVTPIDISASTIRKALARGESIEGKMPPAVLDYIKQQRLYAQQTGT